MPQEDLTPGSMVVGIGLGDEEIGKPAGSLGIVKEVQHLGAVGFAQGGNRFVRDDERRFSYLGRLRTHGDSVPILLPKARCRTRP
ncbi:MAG: hypothetical protein FD137_2557 [Spirochaetes bacterium]|nr:MAG: hypothetical protein FD137_2557 [Spirochaetota bacterium]